MEFETDASVGRTVRTVDVDPEDRRRFAITDEDVIELAKFARIIEKHYGRPDGYRMGQGRHRRQDLHSSGSSGNC